jgi:hypothetical protein
LRSEFDEIMRNTSFIQCNPQPFLKKRLLRVLRREDIQIKRLADVWIIAFANERVVRALIYAGAAAETFVSIKDKLSVLHLQGEEITVAYATSAINADLLI